MRSESIIDDATRDDAWPLLPFVALVLWLTCAAIGIAGLKLHYVRPVAAAKDAAPVAVRLIQADVPRESETMAPADAGAPEEARPPMEDPPVMPPPMAQAAAVASSPPMMSVATSSPAIAFAVPVAGPSRTVDAAHADPGPARAPATTPATLGNTSPVAADNVAPPRPGPPAPRRLTFGQGEGRQPSPDYPPEAALNREEGTVVVRFAVDEHGRVSRVEAAVPCPWAMLNQAALRAVRERWRFGDGPPRVYEVAIEFKLQ